MQTIEIPTRPAGTSGLHLSTLGVGGWSFGGGDYWGPTEQASVDAVVARAVDLGVTYFDTAEAYNGGRSEEALGHALRAAGVDRARVVVGSKVSPSNARHDTLIAHCEASLRRLGLEHLDLYMVHWPIHPHSIRYFSDDPELLANPPTLQEAADALLMLQERGLVRHVGVSNFGARFLEEIERCGVRPAVNQLPYNVLSRAIEADVMPYCRAHGIGIIGYSVLMQALLTDRYSGLHDLPDHQRRTRHFDSARSPLSRHGEPGAEAEVEAALREARAVAAELGRPLAEVAVRWALDDPAVTCVLAGARSPQRIEQNARAAAAGPLPPAMKARLDRASQPVLDALGAHVDYYESAANDRTRWPA